MSELMICPLHDNCPHKIEFPRGNIHCHIHEESGACHNICNDIYKGTECKRATAADLVLYRLEGGKL